jgi:hypothetical protein
MKQIKVKVALDGSTEVEAVGFTGTSCKSATKPIEDALGSVQKSTAKPEQFVQGQQSNIQRNGW